MDGLTNQNHSNNSNNNNNASLKKPNTKQRCARTGLKQVNATMVRNVNSLMVKLNLFKKLLQINYSRLNLASNFLNIQLVLMVIDVISYMMLDHLVKLSQRISTKRD